MSRSCLAALILFTLCTSLTAVRISAEQSLQTGKKYPLTFEMRVRYQRAIEEVYWKHRIWPKENKNAKPPLDQILPDAAIRAKVEDYLKESNALEEYWHRPITAEQLQAEMDRMAKETRNAGMLEELFAALDNDPYVIAECLVRPTLVERLIHNWYSSDARFHCQARTLAETELARYGFAEMKKMRGEYSETEFVKKSEEATERGIHLDPEEWDDWVTHLKQMYGQSGSLPLNRISPLQEDETRFYAMAVLEKQNDRIRIATIEWPKEPFSSWWARERAENPSELMEQGRDYALPAVTGSSCVENTWTPLPGVPSVRHSHTAVWTGSEMIIWGGYNYYNRVNTGGRYSPASDSWTFTETTTAPSVRDGHKAVWTGSEMIVWGGYDGSSYLFSGGRYNPISNSWTATTLTAAPSARSTHTAVWTGSEMIVWGGYNGTSNLNTGGRYNPTSDSWIATSTATAPNAARIHTAVWTGTEMIVWGGVGVGYQNTGGRYNPTSDLWTATPTTGAPAGRSNHTVVWTGTEMIIWGGFNGSAYLNTGGRYNPSSNSWTATSLTSAPAIRDRHAAIWSGNEMIVWGGFSGTELNTGGRYNPSLNSWIATSLTSAPPGRHIHTAIWTGTEMVVWGGTNGNAIDTGGRYNPVSNSWIPMNAGGSARWSHSAVWTGSEMIVWGGISGNGFWVNTGARYNPVSNSWIETSMIAAPTYRKNHTAVWSGTEMIVWGGDGGGGGYLNTGGRYNPASDSWISTDVSAAPLGRTNHTTVWTGTEMIVWGGRNSSGYSNTGGRYIPASDSWISTTITAAPSARTVHTAEWTGTEMIVWGGYNGSASLSTGARYSPALDSWIPTTTATVPTARSGHTAVWTGSEMIIWGGGSGSIGGYLNTGGRYNPASDSWISTNMTFVPDARYSHRAIWTGNEMIVWGGTNSSLLNTGGDYNPISDSWMSTSMTSVPSARYLHTAVWTGSEMIVWGGCDNTVLCGLNTGGRYCVCGTITLTPTSLPNGTVGVAYSTSVSGSGSSAPYTFAVTAGVLPDGLSLIASTGEILGTPSFAASFSFTITATAANGCNGSRTYSVNIVCPSFAIGNNLSVSKSATVHVSWPAVSGAASYNIRRCDASAGICVPSTIANVTALYFDDDVLADGSNYWYALQAVNGNCVAD